MKAFDLSCTVAAALLVALLIAKAPVMDVEISAQLDAEAAAMRTPPPCWDELPFRTPITQENIDRLCIKTPSPQPVPAFPIATLKESLK